MVEEIAPALPADRPRYLMGVGTPERSDRGGGARHRHVRLRAADPQRPPRAAFTRFGQINLATPAMRDDPRPLDEQSPTRPRAPIRAPTCII